MKAIIVDDELSGREVLSRLIGKFTKQVQVVALCESVAAARETIEAKQPDLVFLDIEMPLESGFKLFEYFPQPNFKVIFTTAHQHYAIKAFEFAAVDYLVKPIHYQDLQRAVQKALHQNALDELQNRLQLVQENLVNPFRRIAIPTINGYLFVNIHEILRLESDTNYSIIVLKNQENYTSSRTLRDYEELLSPFNFVRVHRSHLINLNFIREYQKGRSPILVMEDASQIPIAANRKEDFLRHLNKL